MWTFKAAMFCGMSCGENVCEIAVESSAPKVGGLRMGET